MLRTPWKCTKIYNARAQPLFCSLNLLFGAVLVAVVVVVCLSSLISQLCGQLACAEKVLISFRKLSIYARLICYSVHVVKASQLYESICTHVNITRRQILLTLPTCGNVHVTRGIIQYLQFIVVKIIIILKQLDYEVNYNKKKMASISYIIDARLNKRIHISFLCLYPE